MYQKGKTALSSLYDLLTKSTYKGLGGEAPRTHQCILVTSPVQDHHQKADSRPLGDNDTPTHKDNIVEVPLVPEELVFPTPHGYLI